MAIDTTELANHTTDSVDNSADETELPHVNDDSVVDNNAVETNIDDDILSLDDLAFLTGGTKSVDMADFEDETVILSAFENRTRTVNKRNGNVATFTDLFATVTITDFVSYAGKQDEVTPGVKVPLVTARKVNEVLPKRPTMRLKVYVEVGDRGANLRLA